MGNNSQAATAVGSTSGGVILLCWVCKTFFHLDIPVEVAVALMPVLAIPLHALLKWSEAKTGVDLDNNGTVTLPGGVTKP